MSNFVLEIFDDEGEECSFYTVKRLDEDISETEKFFAKYIQDERLKPYVEEIAILLSIVIGEKYGARDEYFRDERQAQALPPNPKIKKNIVEISIYPNSPLRLYCLKLSNACVVLFNGGEKTSQTAQEGKTSMSFYEANGYAEKILGALNSSIKLTADEKSIVDYYESDDISDIIL